MSWPRGWRTGAVRPPSKRIWAKRSITSAEGHSKGAPGQGLKGIRFTLAGMALRSRAISRASAGESFTPFSMTYSKVMRRALWTPG